VLTITNGTITTTVNLVGDYAGHVFKVTSGGAGISTVKDPPAASAPLVQAMAGHASAPAVATSRSQLPNSPHYAPRLITFA
jgi:hypothetical protein